LDRDNGNPCPEFGTVSCCAKKGVFGMDFNRAFRGGAAARCSFEELVGN